MDPARTFKHHPPKRALNSLEAIVEDWSWRFAPGGVLNKHRDHVLEYCAEANDLMTAVIRACASKTAQGKCHNHQSRVPLKIRIQFADSILKTINGSVPKDFDLLHDALENVAFHGIGPVTIYDVATRIAAYAGYEPQSLYIHAGVRKGWEILIGKRERRKRIPRKELPIEFAPLPTDEIEDALCAYRSFLQPWLKGIYPRIGGK